jgi:hypothetical protein
MCIIFQQVLEAFVNDTFTDAFSGITDQDERRRLVEKMQITSDFDTQT